MLKFLITRSVKRCTNRDVNFTIVHKIEINALGEYQAKNEGTQSEVHTSYNQKPLFTFRRVVIFTAIGQRHPQETKSCKETSGNYFLISQEQAYNKHNKQQ